MDWVSQSQDTYAKKVICLFIYFSVINLHYLLNYKYQITMKHLQKDDQPFFIIAKHEFLLNFYCKLLKIKIG